MEEKLMGTIFAWLLSQSINLFYRSGVLNYDMGRSSHTNFLGGRVPDESSFNMR